ncbi:MAG TPA: AAA family ATPase [Terriglobales bacterium]|nr:AAA family ATPase [Terriglobales bacterium]
MHGIAVALLSEDREQSAILQNRLESTHIARVVFSNVGFPLSATDPVVRQMQAQRAEVVLGDVNSEDPQRAIRTIELIRATTSDIAIFAIGDMRNPMAIVGSMRAGAGEFIDRNTGTEGLLEAFSRFSAARSRSRSTGKARVFTVINAKGGSGATTLAVNTAVALQQHGQTILVDFSPIGHAALHLNARPTFSVMDALQNLHRMDASLLEGLMTSTKDGLHLLAGPQQPYTTAPAAAELARLFDLLVSHYRYVVVDCSGRMDQTTRLLSDLSNVVLMVAQTDVVSLWSASRIRSFLEEGNGRKHLRLVMNRYKKIPGFSEEDVERATNVKILWKIPNNYQLIAPAIDKGTPIAATHDSQEVSRAFRSLAELLAQAPAAAEEGLDLVFQAQKDTKKAPNRLLINPQFRTGQ